jgi:hypothetical protein
MLTIFALLFTEQRIESREISLEITKLSKDIETLNSRKQELTVLIEQERSRLVKQSRNMGKPLSPKDVLIIK